MRFRESLICGCLFLNACGDKVVHEDISDVKYQVNRISSPLDEQPYRVGDEFNFLDRYSGNAKIIKSDVIGKCISDIDKSDVKPINTTINDNKFLLGAVLSAEFLVSTNRNADLYSCYLTVSGITDVGSQVDVPIVLEWYRDDFLGIDLGVKENSNSYTEFELDIDEDFLVEALEEYSNGSVNPGIRLVCNIDENSPTSMVVNSLISNDPIENKGNNNVLHILFYLTAMFIEVTNEGVYELMSLTDCVVTNNKFNTPEFQWSRVVDLASFGVSTAGELEAMDKDKINRIGFFGKLSTY